MTNVLNIAFALLIGLLMTRLFSKKHLPDVTAFLVAGVLIGPFVLGRVGVPGLGFSTYEEVAGLSTISNVAMGFIAFSIGSEFRLEDLKKTGKKAAVIGVVQALCATVLVDAAMLILHFIAPDVISVPAAITLGAIATATAPAATMMVIRQYKADGPLTRLLLPIVALDDAVGLIVFAISFGVARSFYSGSLSISAILIEPMLEIILSLLLGTITGVLLTEIERLFHSNTNRASLSIGFVLLMVALSSLDFELFGLQLGFSPLLVCMMFGTVFCNICPLSEDLMGRADRWSVPLMAVFFVTSGAELELEIFKSPILVLTGVIYILFRCLGKYIGAYSSAKAMKCEPQVTKFLGITLFPQAGVALGMCVTAQQLGTDGTLIRNITLFSVLVYELIGPLLTKKSLAAAGEIREKPAELLHRRERTLLASPKKALAEKYEKAVRRKQDR